MANFKLCHLEPKVRDRCLTKYENKAKISPYGRNDKDLNYANPNAC